MEKAEEIKKRTIELSQLEGQADWLRQTLGEKQDQLRVCEAYFHQYERELGEKEAVFCKEIEILTEAVLRLKRDTQAQEKENVATLNHFYQEFKAATLKSYH